MTIAPLFQSSATTAPIWLGTAVQNSMHSSFSQPARFSGIMAGLMQSSSVTQGDEWSQQKIEGLQTIRNSLLNTAPADSNAHAKSLQELAHMLGISKSTAGPVERPLQDPESAVKLNELTGKVSDYLKGEILHPSPDSVPQDIQDAAKLINAASIQADSDPLLQPFKEKWASDLESLQSMANALPIAETIVEPSERDAASDFVSLVQEAVNALDEGLMTGKSAGTADIPEAERNEPLIPAAPDDVNKEETATENDPISFMTQKESQTALGQQEMKNRNAHLTSNGQIVQEEIPAAVQLDRTGKSSVEIIQTNDVPAKEVKNTESTAAVPAAVKSTAETTHLSSGTGNDKTAGKELLLELKSLLSAAPDEKGVIKQSSEAMQLLEKAVALIKGSESPTLHEKETTVQEKAVTVIKQVQELARQLTADRPMTPAKSIETILTAVLQSLPEETGIQPEGKNAGLTPEGKQLALLQTMANVQQRLTTITYGVPLQANTSEPENMRHTVENDLAQPVQLNLLQLQSFGSKGPAAARSHQPDLFSQFQSVMKQSRFGKVNGAEKLLIRLQPEHLGSLKIELTRHEGQLSARVTASTAAGKEMLESQIHQLRQALTGQNIQVDKLDIIFAQEESPLLKEQKDERNETGGDQQQAKEEQQEVAQDFREIFMNVEV